jgi:ParB family chromosome partitioning protein
MNDDMRLAWLNVDQLEPHPDNPRKDLGDLTDLAASISAQGIKQNLLVVPIEGSEARYRVIIGHRRLAASKLAGLQQVPCAISELSDLEQRELMIVENSQRADLTAIEEADAYQGLLDLGLKTFDIARRTGRSGKYVRTRLKAASIPKTTRELASDFAQLSITELDALAEFAGDPDTQRMLARVAGTREWDWKLEQARESVRSANWLKTAREVVDRYGIPIIENPIREEEWMTPKGYEYERGFYGNDKPFATQWKDYLAEHADIEPHALLKGHCVEIYVVADPQKDDQDTLKEKAARAKRLAWEKQVKEFHQQARALREQWVREHVRTMTDKELHQAVVKLTLPVLMGSSAYGFFRGLDSTTADLAVESYNRIRQGDPLPVTAKDASREIWHLMCQNNWDELNRRQQLNDGERELFLLLVVSCEAFIAWRTWTGTPNIESSVRPYYSLLEQLGYPISSEETAAIQGQYAGEDNQ